MTRERSEAAADDDAWLGLRREGDRVWFELSEELTRGDGMMFGGTAVAAATAAMGSSGGREPMWVTVQFVTSVPQGCIIDITTEVLARGRRVSQMRITGTSDTKTVFTALGAVGTHHEDGLDHLFHTPPKVEPPEPDPGFEPDGPLPGWYASTQLIPANWSDGAQPGNRMAVWVRWRDHPMTRAGLAMFADMVPGVVLRAAGRSGFGVSLDNTVRFGALPDSEWVLIEILPDIALGGITHGSVRMWSPTGALLAVAGQTATLRLTDT